MRTLYKIPEGEVLFTKKEFKLFVAYTGSTITGDEYEDEPDLCRVFYFNNGINRYEEPPDPMVINLN